MSRAFWIPALVGTAAAAYAVHGVVTDTGPAGWLNYLQQSIFGAYSMKVTVLILMFAVIAIGAVAAVVGSIGVKADTRLSPAVDAALFGTPGQTTPAAATMSIVFGVLILITWAIGYGYYWWSNRTDRADAAAEYQPIALSDGAPAPAAAGSHVALSGRLLRERTIEFSKGSGSSGKPQYLLVPVASPGWSNGQPVSYVIKVKRLEDLGLATASGVPLWRPPGQRQAQAQPVVWLGRLDGEVPVSAVQILAKEGVPMAPGAKLVQWLPSQDGRPAIPDRSEQEFQIFLIICGGITVLLVVMLPAILWGSKRQERRRSRMQSA